MKPDGKHPRDLVRDWLNGVVEHVVFYSYTRSAFVRYTDKDQKGVVL